MHVDPFFKMSADILRGTPKEESAGRARLFSIIIVFLGRGTFFAKPNFDLFNGIPILPFVRRTWR